MSTEAVTTAPWGHSPSHAGTAPPLNKPARNRGPLGLIAWIVGVLFVSPALWMVFLSFHNESDAASNPPKFTAPLTLAGYRDFFSGCQSPWPSLANSAIASVCSTILVLLLAIPAAYALSIRPVKKWTDVMFFFLSTKMMPAVAGLLPIYLTPGTPTSWTTYGCWWSSTPA